MSKLKVASVCVAAALLGGALYYYNFVDKAAVSGVEKGNKCPDFTAQVYEEKEGTFSLSEETFTLSQQIGKVCIINFWETWCQACIEELPEFNKIQEEYEGEVEVVAAVGSDGLTAESKANWMTDKGWKSYDQESDWTKFSLNFVYLDEETSKNLGCGGMLPRTVIVDKSGIVVHEVDGTMTHQELQNILAGIL